FRRLRLEIAHQKGRAELAQEQRDIARTQRDQARAQRDEAFKAAQKHLDYDGLKEIERQRQKAELALEQRDVARAQRDEAFKAAQKHLDHAGLKEIERQRQKAELARAQRDQARAQRDVARAQRDEAFKAAQKHLDHAGLKEIERQRQKAELARVQRDVARQQRDDARAQRDEARFQRREAMDIAKRAETRLDTVRAKKKLNYLNEIREAYKKYSEIKAENPTLEQAPLIVKEMHNGVHPPNFSQIFPERATPPETVAFITVSNYLFVPGLEVLVNSLLTVYPDFRSDIIVFNDGTISDFCQNRLKAMYPRIYFEEPDMTWIPEIPQDSGNRKRIGILGYMSVMALGKAQYKRVVVLDSDTAIIDDISMFWTGRDRPLGSTDPVGPVDPDHIFTCQDYGDRPWAALSPTLQKPIINSGIISVPRRYMAASDLDEIKALVSQNHEAFCPLLDRFADQKAWNRFIYARDTQFLPINFNCNIRFLDKFRGGDISFVRMIHFAGYKPWFDKSYIDDALIPETESAAVNPGIWRDLNLCCLGRMRQKQYQREISSRPNYFKMMDNPRILNGEPTCMFIGNGPSLNETDLSRLQNFETFVFNWFLLHPEFDTLKPKNLVLGSHMFFGGWQTQRPTIPKEYIAELREKSWRPQLWTSFYFREYFNNWELKDEFDIRYVLFEKPHKDFVDVTGTPNMDVRGFTHDGRTGVLSMALPTALEKGYRQIALVGCDSNYNQSANSDSNYFYDAAKHVSKKTRQDSLTQTWVNDGPGFFAYTRIHDALQQHGGGFLDFTLNGALPLPKGDLNTL
ncbi:MAG: hypothetical protein GDA36_12300, partial [Rhodobacteraceae bacterium]|nr:hypothetical protein [Paracoccaceae bacterium]